MIEFIIDIAILCSGIVGGSLLTLGYIKKKQEKMKEEMQEEMKELGLGDL